MDSLIIFCAAMGTVCLFFATVNAQEIIFEVNAYKTSQSLVEMGDWDDPNTWEVWNGKEWTPSLTIPGSENDVFIDQDTEVRLAQNQEVRNLYLFSSEGPGRKLNLQEYNLDVYGALRCFTTSGEIFSLAGTTSALMDWIYPETGNIVFKGTSRTIVDRASWSANNLNSRFGVKFNPDPGDTLEVNAALKANSFILQSGTVVQTVNSDPTPATSTFSFNTQNAFGSEAYGSFIIEPGATLISEGTREFGEIIRRSISQPAADFHLKDGGTLILLGEEPVIVAENITLEGDVHYYGDSESQQFIAASMDETDFPSTYKNLFFEGSAQKFFPEVIELKGDLTFIGGGDIVGEHTQLYLSGDEDQDITNYSLEVAILEITKPTGTLSFHEDLSIREHFTMNQGEIDFMGNLLNINISGEGSYSYYGGFWRNLDQLNYLNVPTELSSTNSTFPFEDQLLGGQRKIFFSGSHSAENSDLSLVYTQIPGVNWDVGFNDHDGAPILYKTNSYFTLGLTNTSVTDPVELHISADNLIVVDEQHLRIVSDQAAAPGEHLPGRNNGEYLANRSVGLNELNNQTFTIGSTGTASILPLRWLSYTAKEQLTGNLIEWSTSQNEEIERFLILKTMGASGEFMQIGEVRGPGTTNKVQHFSFLDKAINRIGNIFYQIKQVDQNGSFDFSPLFPLRRIENSISDQFMVFPNPFENGELKLSVPKDWNGSEVNVQIMTVSGITLMEVSGRFGKIERKITDRLMEFGSGAYLISIETKGVRQFIKWFKN